MTPLLFDIGTGELLLLVVLGAVLLGPEKVPELAKKAARVLGFLRKVANNATDQIKAELGPEFADVTLKDLKDLKDLKPGALVAKILPSDMQSEMDSLRAELAAMRGEVDRLHHQTVDDVHDATAAPADLLPDNPLKGGLLNALLTDPPVPEPTPATGDGSWPPGTVPGHPGTVPEPSADPPVVAQEDSPELLAGAVVPPDPLPAPEPAIATEPESIPAPEPELWLRGLFPDNRRPEVSRAGGF